MPSVTGPSSRPFFLPYRDLNLCMASSCSCFDSPPNLRFALPADAAVENGRTLIDLTTASFASFEAGFDGLMADGFGVWLGAPSMRTSPPTKPSKPSTLQRSLERATCRLSGASSHVDILATTRVAVFSWSCSFDMSTGSCKPAGLMMATETHVAPRSAFVRRRSLSTQILSPSASTSSSSSNHSCATRRSTPRRKTAPLLATSSRPLRRRTVLAVLFPLFLDTAPTLLLSRFAELRSDFWRVLGATMTSASGEILTNSEPAGGAGATEVTMMFAVVVGERWSVRGWGVCACGLGRARIWDKKLSSRNWACSSIISQSTGVRGSMLMVCACGGRGAAVCPLSVLPAGQ